MLLRIIQVYWHGCTHKWSHPCMVLLHLKRRCYFITAEIGSGDMLECTTLLPLTSAALCLCVCPVFVRLFRDMEKLRLKPRGFKFAPVKGWLGGDQTEKVEGWKCTIYEAAGKVGGCACCQVGIGRPQWALLGVNSASYQCVLASSACFLQGLSSSAHSRSHIDVFCMFPCAVFPVAASCQHQQGAPAAV